MIWIFMWTEEPEIKSKQASERDRNLRIILEGPKIRYDEVDESSDGKSGSQ